MEGQRRYPGESRERGKRPAFELRTLVARSWRALLSLAFLGLAVLPARAADGDAGIQTVVEERYKQWIAAASAKDLAAMTSLYDENAVLMPKQEEPVIGRAAIASYYEKLFADPHYVAFTETVQSNSFHATGDVAIETADFDGQLTRNEKPIHFRGKVLLVWRKQRDGSWKIFRYMFDEIPAKK